jgi:hypothetical protein
MNLQVSGIIQVRAGGEITAVHFKSLMLRPFAKNRAVGVTLLRCWLFSFLCSAFQCKDSTSGAKL